MRTRCLAAGIGGSGVCVSSFPGDVETRAGLELTDGDAFLVVALFALFVLVVLLVFVLLIVASSNLRLDIQAG